MPAAPPDAITTWRPREPVDVTGTLAALRRGAGDPTHRVEPGVVWRTSRAATGPVTLRLCLLPGGAVEAAAWGPGADEAVAGVPDLCGGRDDPTGFAPAHPVLRDSARRHPGLRVPRCGRVLEMLVPAILEQKVTGTEARRSWRYLVLRFGEPAPGPAPEGMRVVPRAGTWRLIPSWEWHRAGVDAKRTRTVIAAAAVAARLEETVDTSLEEARRRLRAVPGVGIWTAAEVMQRAHGDADAVSVGDFHLAALIGWALVGRPLDDDGMLEVLAAYAPHRYRAVRLVELSGVRKPRFGPRYSPQDMRAM